MRTPADAGRFISGYRFERSLAVMRDGGEIVTVESLRAACRLSAFLDLDQCLAAVRYAGPNTFRQAAMSKAMSLAGMKHGMTRSLVQGAG